MKERQGDYKCQATERLSVNKNNSQYNQKNSTDDFLCKLRIKQGKKRIETNLRLSENHTNTHKHNGVLVMFLQI